MSSIKGRIRISSLAATNRVSYEWGKKRVSVVLRPTEGVPGGLQAVAAWLGPSGVEGEK